MAIQKTLQVDLFGRQIEFVDAYCFPQSIKTEQRDVRIQLPPEEGAKEGKFETHRLWVLSFVLMCYTSKTVKDTNGEPFLKMNFDVLIPENNTLSANALAYAVVKQHEKFQGSVDC